MLTKEKSDDPTSHKRWKTVPVNTNYEVSDSGGIRRKKNNGDYSYLSPCLTRYGYRRACLSKGGQSNYHVHRLVLLAFVGNPPEGRDQAAHINGVKTDNRLENLYWASPKENIDDQVRHGTSIQKLTEEEVKRIKARLRNQDRGTDIARDYGVQKWTIYAIKHGRSWVEV